MEIDFHEYCCNECGESASLILEIVGSRLSIKCSECGAELKIARRNEPRFVCPTCKNRIEKIDVPYCEICRRYQLPFVGYGKCSKCGKDQKVGRTGMYINSLKGQLHFCKECSEEMADLIKDKLKLKTDKDGRWTDYPYH